MNRFRTIGLVLLCWLAPVPAARALAVSFQGLGPLPGYTTSRALDVSADGSVVAGVSIRFNGGTGSRESEASRWTADGAVSGLGFLAGYDASSAAAATADGSALVGTCENTLCGQEEAFRWTEAGGMVGLGFLSGATSSSAVGVSADGSVVVGTSGEQAFRWTEAEGMVGLGFLPEDESSAATGVSADGSVLAGYSANEYLNSKEAFRWTAETGMVGLGFLPGYYNESLATGVSADGSTVVGSSWMVFPNWYDIEAFRWTEGEGMQSLGVPPWHDYPLETPADASADGSTVVGTTSILWAGAGSRAFVWDAAGGWRILQDALIGDDGLDLEGWWLREATGISDDGTVVVGYGYNPSDRTRAWRVVVAEPSSSVLAAIAIVALLVIRCRRRGS